MEFMVFRHVGRRSSMATVTIFDATGIIFINVWRFEVLSLIPTGLFWLPLYIEHSNWTCRKICGKFKYCSTWMRHPCKNYKTALISPYFHNSVCTWFSTNTQIHHKNSTVYSLPQEQIRGK
jgi:hypothetical protein